MTQEAEDIQVALETARRCVRQELAEVHAAIDVYPACLTRSMAEKVVTWTALLLDLDNAVIEMEGHIARLIGVNDAVKRQMRYQKMWRILACRACLGGVNINQLMERAFRDFISEPPADDVLEAELEQVITQLERYEQATAEFGELRQIILNP